MSMPRALGILIIATGLTAAERIPESSTTTLVPPAVATQSAQKQVPPFIAKLTIAEFHDEIMPALPLRWNTPRTVETEDGTEDREPPPMIAQILDAARDGDVQYLRQRYVEPGLARRADDDARLAALPAAKRQQETEARTAAALTAMLATWDQNKDGRITLAEFGDFTVEMIPLVSREGEASSRTVVERYLVANRYADLDKDRTITAVEWDIFDNLRSDLYVARGDLSRTIREWPVWVERARRAGWKPPAATP
jgi:hypothetical protein